jgi:hypothetical protein
MGVFGSNLDLGENMRTGGILGQDNWDRNGGNIIERKIGVTKGNLYIKVLCKNDVDEDF